METSISLKYFVTDCSPISPVANENHAKHESLRYSVRDHRLNRTC